jgi:putative transposase
MRRRFVSAARAHGVRIHAYVWMTNHIHLLATPDTAESLGKTFQSAGRRYVQHFNRVYGRSGTLWEGRYRATVVDSAHYLFTVMRYIELNPLRAGMVTQPEDYPWSSYRHNALGEGGSNFDWLSPQEEYLRLGASLAERQAAYRALFTTQIDNVTLAEVRERTHKAWALGGADFISRVEALSQRRAASKGVGRPRKDEQRGDLQSNINRV